MDTDSAIFKLYFLDHTGEGRRKIWGKSLKVLEGFIWQFVSLLLIDQLITKAVSEPTYASFGRDMGRMVCKRKRFAGLLE